MSKHKRSGSPDPDVERQERGAPHYHIHWPDWCQEGDLSIWETHHDGPVPGNNDHTCGNAKTQQVDDIYRKNVSKIQADIAVQAARNEAEAALFPEKTWDSLAGFMRCERRLERTENSSSTPQEIGKALEDHTDLRHRLASSPMAHFFYKCRFRADKLLYRCIFNNLRACHAVVRRAALLADEMTSISTDFQIDQSMLTAAAAVAAEIDAMTRYIERDTAMFYRCHIRPVLLEYNRVSTIQNDAL